MFQTLLPALSHAEHESEVTIIGGTANPMAPPALEIKEVFLYLLEKFGIKVDFNIMQEGFYPRGGGKIHFKVHPIQEFKEFNLLEKGKYLETNVTAVSSQELEKADVAKRLLKGFKLKYPMEKQVNTKEFYEKTFSTGCYITAHASYEHTRLGFTVLGERGKRSEDLGKECAKKLLEIMESEATVDMHEADQLLLYVA